MFQIVHLSICFRREKSCFQCYQIYNRTRNILQIRKSECNEITSVITNQMNFQELCATIHQDAEFDTLFCNIFHSTNKRIIHFFLI